MEFAESVYKHRGVPEVARFGLSCGLLSEDDGVVYGEATAHSYIVVFPANTASRSPSLSPTLSPLLSSLSRLSSLISPL